jgi:hypothetical protein
LTTDQLTLTDALGRSTAATLLHVYDRADVAGAIDKATPTFKAMAALLFQSRPQAERAALVRVGAFPLFLAEINRCWWTSDWQRPEAPLLPVNVQRRISATSL